MPFQLMRVWCAWTLVFQENAIFLYIKYCTYKSQFYTNYDSYNQLCFLYYTVFTLSIIYIMTYFHISRQLEVISLPRRRLCDNDLWQTFGWTDWQASMKSRQRSKSSSSCRHSASFQIGRRNCMPLCVPVCALVRLSVCVCAKHGWAGQADIQAGGQACLQ